MQKIEALDLETQISPNNSDIADCLSQAKAELDNIHKIESEGIAVKNRALNSINGEKPTKHFCNLVKGASVQKFIPSLIKDDGKKSVHLTSQHDV